MSQEARSMIIRTGIIRIITIEAVIRAIITVAEIVEKKKTEDCSFRNGLIEKTLEGQRVPPASRVLKRKASTLVKVLLSQKARLRTEQV